VRVERHWWNGIAGRRGRRDVYIRTDGERWEVEAKMGGAEGRSRVQQCPGESSAQILADAWLGGRPEWREMHLTPAQPVAPIDRPAAQATSAGG
jgi:hypothetical protein